jgi:hypothetical protein
MVAVELGRRYFHCEVINVIGIMKGNARKMSCLAGILSGVRVFKAFMQFKALLATHGGIALQS